jgi:hypothetical protein
MRPPELGRLFTPSPAGPFSTASAHLGAWLVSRRGSDAEIGDARLLIARLPQSIGGLNSSAMAAGISFVTV